MKTIKQFLKTTILILTLFLFSCSNNDSGSTRATEFIDIYIDGNLTTYSTNIIAKDYPLPSTTGSSNIFRITSEDTSLNKFEMLFPFSNISPFVVNVPSSETLSPSIGHFLKIAGINFDDTNSLNSLVVNYTAFGSNISDNIQFDISGNYYEVGSTTAHTLYVGVDILRD